MPQEPVQIPHPESPEGAEPDIAVDDGRLKTGDTVQIGVDPDVLLVVGFTNTYEISAL
jgi:hypothetical protein